MVNILEIAKLQAEYENLVAAKKLSKRALCDLCIPFRDKAGLTDIQTLRIARSELSLAEILTVCGIDKVYENINAEEFANALSELNFFRNCHYSDSTASEEYRLTQAINTILPVLAKLTGTDAAE